MFEQCDRPDNTRNLMFNIYGFDVHVDEGFTTSNAIQVLQQEACSKIVNGFSGVILPVWLPNIKQK